MKLIHAFGATTDFCIVCGMSLTQAVEDGSYECPGRENQPRDPEEAEAMWKRGMSGVGF